MVSVLFGSTAFDSFKDSTRWLRFSQEHSDHSTLLNTGALVVTCLAVFVTFALTAMTTATLGHVHRRTLPNLLAHSVVPIVVGYIVAHYLSFFVSSGLATLEQLGDPLGRGWALTSWASGVNRYAIYDHPTALAVVKVLAVVVKVLAVVVKVLAVVVKVLGVIAAHDRCVRVLPRGRVVLGQLPDDGADDGLHAHRPLVAVLLLNTDASRQMVASPASPSTVSSAQPRGI